MSTVFTPGWSWTSSTRHCTASLEAPTQSSFAPKVANNSMNSFHLVESTYGQPAYLQVRCSKVEDIYENTGVSPAFQMPVKTGKKAELTFYGLGNVEMTQGTVTKDYLTPLSVSLSFQIPEVSLDTDENMNATFLTLINQMILGPLLQTTTEGGTSTTVPDFMQVLKGVLNLPGVLPTTSA